MLCALLIQGGTSSKATAVLPLTSHLKEYNYDEQDTLGTSGELRMNT